MSRVILFDVNETLLDLSMLRPHFVRIFGEQASMGVWFSLLLHSSLVVTLADAYTDFGSLAGAALDIVAAQRGVVLAEADRQQILDSVRRLPPHPDVVESLERLRQAGLRLATLTNSSNDMLSAQMENAGLSQFFEILLSVEEVGKFKPAAEPYRMAADRLNMPPEGIRMVAAHDWDVFGALQAGLAGAFIARAGKPYHPLYGKPDIMEPGLKAVTDRILEMDL